ncbi:thermostable hemolysin [Pectobacteriaceae bacterium CE70]|nr:thermostable hemolysin [Pectobacteriaceae bacterium C52]WJV67740.1 thermostable hemolysin [Pectobacteriaceae bacterium CE70]WJY11683.1 thermostable hemolysin [Pectobacteriaceae bacterium C80]
MYLMKEFHPEETEYQVVKQCVSLHYKDVFGASVQPQPDFFICLTKLDGKAPGYSCLGITTGDKRMLFSEHYINTDLSKQYGVDRGQIVEIGSFCSFSSNGYGKYILSLALSHLSLHKYQLVIMTATPQVRKILQTLKVCYTDMGVENYSRVPDLNVNWGSYYDNDPRVVVFPLRDNNIFHVGESGALIEGYHAVRNIY